MNYELLMAYLEAVKSVRKDTAMFFVQPVANESGYTKPGACDSMVFESFAIEVYAETMWERPEKILVLP